MLTKDQTAIVKATVPLLEVGGEMLTRHFYRIMLDEYPQVRPLFNQAHQASGAQPRALANSVLQYARHIDDLGQLGDLPAQIIQKHVALQVQEQHYPIVGACLLRAIREVLGEEVATDAVLAAWGAAYQQLAAILTGAEAAEYDRLAEAPGGWRGARRFRLAQKLPESAEVTSFYLEPEDGGPIVTFVPGQYLGIALTIDGVEVRRNYSLSQAPNGRNYRISVKREAGGVVSCFLHERLAVGDTIDVFPPAGAFQLSNSDRPLVLISGGIGITPTLAMAEAALASGGRTVTFIHYARNPAVQAFRDTLARWQTEHGQFNAHVVLEQGALQGAPSGRPTLAQLREWVMLHAEAYFLGPKPFMAFVRDALTSIGLPKERCRYEFFGPAEALG